VFKQKHYRFKILSWGILNSDLEIAMCLSKNTCCRKLVPRIKLPSKKLAGGKTKAG
jgi:hypothetical protein